MLTVFVEGARVSGHGGVVSGPPLGHEVTEERRVERLVDVLHARRHLVVRLPVEQPAARATVAESALGCAREGRYVRGTPEVADA